MNLRSISIPKSVTSIGMFAFDCCFKLETVIIPNSVTSVGQNAFSKCSNLKEVFCYAEKVPSLNSSVFYLSNIENSTLWIPEASVVEYMSADQWKDFGTIKFIEGTNVIPLINMNEKTMIYNLNGSIQNNRIKGFNIIQNTNGESKKVYIK